VPGVPCLFVNQYLIVFFYVDDLIAACLPQHNRKLQDFKKALMARYEMKDLGEISWFLGIRVLRDRPSRKLWLCQDSYVDKIAGKFNQKESELLVHTPLAVDNLVPYEGTASAAAIHGYQQKIGSLLYAAVNTRPDVARTCSRLAEFARNPSPAHHLAADRAIAYLYQTRGYAIQFSGDTIDTDQMIIRASDASFADDPNTRHSSQGYILKLFGGPVDWKATKQNHVMKSSTDAELTAVSSAVSEFMWWQRLFAQLDLVLDGNKAISVLCDNQQTIRLLHKTGAYLNTSLKHVDVHNHWLRQEVQAGNIRIDWVASEHMIADGLTKALPRQKHENFVRQLGLVDVLPTIRG
jgi:hypothetical protein